jgi:hypothetical protein
VNGFEADCFPAFFERIQNLNAYHVKEARVSIHVHTSREVFFECLNIEYFFHIGYVQLTDHQKVYTQRASGTLRLMEGALLRLSALLS